MHSGDIRKDTVILSSSVAVDVLNPPSAKHKIKFIPFSNEKFDVYWGLKLEINRQVTI